MKIQLTIAGVVVILVLGIGVFLLSQTQDATPHPERMENTGCPVPCWRGQGPGVTFEAFQAALESFGVTDIGRYNNQLCGKAENIGIACAVQPPGQSTAASESLVWGLPIPSESRPAARLVDAIAAYGEPEQAKICWSVNTWHAAIRFPNFIVLLARGGDLLDGEPMAYSPGQWVERVAFYTADSFPKLEWQEMPVWTGYGPPSTNQTACKL